MKKSVEPRNATQLSEPLNHHLTQYALAAGAAGVGLLALAQPAEAKVVYTKTHQMIHGLHHFVNLDVNNDGITDFKLAIVSPFESYGEYLTIYPFSNNVRRTSRNGWAAAYPAGVRIGPKGRQARPAKSVYGILMERGWYFDPGERGSGNWLDVKNQYLGLAFVTNGETHYGWARLSATLGPPPQNAPRARLTGYAYETIPNKPIITGKTKGPDVIILNPGSLGTLAAGASRPHR